MDVWPITIEGCIHQVRKHPKRWEIGHCNKSQILELPLDIYYETVGTKDGYLGIPQGIQIRCEDNNLPPQSVNSLFHRYRNNKGIWIASLFRKTHDPVEVYNWYNFLSSFGAQQGHLQDDIPVYLEFYADLKVIIRLRTGNSSQVKCYK